MGIDIDMPLVPESSVRDIKISKAWLVAAARLSTPSLQKMCSRCFRMVPSPEPRIVAISGFDLPWDTQSNTVASRGVNPKA